MGFNPQNFAVRRLSDQELTDAETLIRRKDPERAEWILQMLGLMESPKLEGKTFSGYAHRPDCKCPRCSPITHCKRGHELLPETTYVRKDGRRRCRTCSNLASKRKYYRKNHKVDVSVDDPSLKIDKRWKDAS